MYIEKEVRTASIKRWAESLPVGTEFGITECANRYQATLPAYRSPSGFGGQTIARVLVEHCGWKRKVRSVTKSSIPSKAIEV